MPQVAKYIRKQRAKELREECDKNLKILKNKLRGTKQKVLIEGNGMGRLENYLQVKVGAEFCDCVGEVVKIEI